MISADPHQNTRQDNGRISTSCPEIAPSLVELHEASSSRRNDERARSRRPWKLSVDFHEREHFAGRNHHESVHRERVPSLPPAPLPLTCPDSRCPRTDPFLGRTFPRPLKLFPLFVLLRAVDFFASYRSCGPPWGEEEQLDSPVNPMTETAPMLRVSAKIC